mmetsp:Transcript_5469/g.16260  ORF Transcript_5469/g.16260 Transcript_5469/m.16260 type:complete len:373 (-) Transcript_5469:936-2054(-)
MWHARCGRRECAHDGRGRVGAPVAIDGGVQRRLPSGRGHGLRSMCAGFGRFTSIIVSLPRALQRRERVGDDDGLRRGLRAGRVLRGHVRARRRRHLHEGRGRRRRSGRQGRAGHPRGRPAQPRRRRRPGGRHGRRLRRQLGGRLRIRGRGDHRGHDPRGAAGAGRGRGPGARGLLPARRALDRRRRVVAGRARRVQGAGRRPREEGGRVRAHGRAAAGLPGDARRRVGRVRPRVLLAPGRRGRARRVAPLPGLRAVRLRDGLRVHARVALLHGLRLRARPPHRRVGDDGPRDDHHHGPRGGAGERRRAGAHGGRRGRRVLPPGEDVRRRGDVRGPGRGGARRGPLRDRGGDDGHARLCGLRAGDEQLRADRR